MITRPIPYETEAHPNCWRDHIRHVPEYRNYRFLVDDALRIHRLTVGGVSSGTTACSVAS
jgi:hypothetical protein